MTLKDSNGGVSSARIIAFAATANGDVAKAFYGGTLGLTLREDSPFALVFDANGVMLRIQKLASVTPPANTVLGWDVADIRATIRDLAQRGVTFERYPRLEQDDLGVWRSPAGAFVAWFKDPDGNVLSLTQFAS